MCASHSRHFRRLRRHRRSLQGKFEASKTEDSRDDARWKRSRDHQDIGRPLEKPNERNLHGRGTETRSDVRQGSRLEWSEPSEWKEWHVGDTFTSKIGYECIIGSMREVVVVLYADDRSDLSGFRDLRGRDVAQPDMTQQTLLLELG